LEESGILGGKAQWDAITDPGHLSHPGCIHSDLAAQYIQIQAILRAEPLHGGQLALNSIFAARIRTHFQGVRAYAHHVLVARIDLSGSEDFARMLSQANHRLLSFSIIGLEMCRDEIGIAKEFSSERGWRPVIQLMCRADIHKPGVTHDRDPV